MVVIKPYPVLTKKNEIRVHIYVSSPVKGFLKFDEIGNIQRNMNCDIDVDLSQVNKSKYKDKMNPAFLNKSTYLLNVLRFRGTNHEDKIDLSNIIRCGGFTEYIKKLEKSKGVGSGH